MSDLNKYKGEKEREREHMLRDNLQQKLYSIVMHLDPTHRLVMIDWISMRIPFAALAA